MQLKNFRLLSIIFSLTLVSCNKPTEEKKILAVGDNIQLLDNVNLDFENAFLDDFTDGVNKENWFIGDQAWGSGNGGVIPENVSYSDDGILQLRGNGGYYQQKEVRGVGEVKDGRYTGAALISNFLVGPGRYEIKMKVLPRLGACTAFWTFAYEFDNELNHEIDIELPGGNRNGNVSFENLLNTNYTKESESISQDTKVGDLFDSGVYLNDGKWHTFGFDWYTNPEAVIYSVDGKVCAVSDIFVPSLLSRLWVGVWFPVSSSFVGTANFEQDYMFVDYIKYIPFKNQPSTDYNPSPNGCASDNEYPTIPQNAPSINKISNGTFEYLDEANMNKSGWTLSRYLFEEKPIEEVCFLSNDTGVENSKGLIIKDGGIAKQTIDAVYSGFEHSLSFKAKGKGKFTVNYYSLDKTMPLKSTKIEIDSNDDYKEFTKDLIAPENTQSIEIRLDTETGNQVQFDNINLYQKKGENK